jgi:hypothetical protein
MSHYYDQVLVNLNTSYGFTPERRMRLIHGYDEYPSETDLLSDEFQSNEFSINNEIAFVLD